MLNRYLQVCIVMDVNASMKKYIHSLKDQIIDIINDVKNDNGKCSIQIAVIGYTAIADWPRERYLKFTTDLSETKALLKKISVSDGYTSDCRYVVDGYARANNLDWVANRKIIFHMGNAPSYGRNYHNNNVNDDFPSGHPYWTLEDEIQCIASKDIDVVILKISKTTTVMEKLLENNYRSQRDHGFYIVDLTNDMNNLDTKVYDVVKKHLQRLLA